MNRKPSQTLAIALLGALLLCIFPTRTFAHEGQDLQLGGFLAGFVHPILGYDHLLAMICVGIIGAQTCGKATWGVPAAFVGGMALGGLLGVINLGELPVEIGIALSVVLFGGALAAQLKLPFLYAALLGGVFALFHGYAHGLEMPSSVSPWAYTFGFLSGTVLIHGVGILISDMAKRYERGQVVLRVGAALVAIIGLLFLFGLV
jgi:urease accessory protein